jgi:hypothetical protein
VSIFFFAVFLYSWPNPASPQKYLPLSQILEHVESNCPSAINFLDYHCFTTDYFMVLSSHTMMIFQYPVRLPVPHIYKMVFWPFTMHLNLNFHVPHDWCPEYLILLSFNASSHVKSSSIRLASHLAIQHMYYWAHMSSSFFFSTIAHQDDLQMPSLSCNLSHYITTCTTFSSNLNDWTLLLHP